MVGHWLTTAAAKCPAVYAGMLKFKTRMVIRMEKTPSLKA
jgi:hypothetical protein